MSPSGDRRRTGIRKAACHANATRTGAAGVLRGQSPCRRRATGGGRAFAWQVALPSECHKDGSRRGSQGAGPMSPSGDRRRPGIREAASQANTTRTGAAGVLRGQSPCRRRATGGGRAFARRLAKRMPQGREPRGFSGGRAP